MTVDIRTAARREAERRTIEPNVEDPLPGDYRTLGWRDGFAWGAVWAQARVTPTREQIAELIEQNSVTPRTDAEHCADAVLALLRASAYPR